MAVRKQASSRLHPSALLGLNVGSVNTRAALFGISEGKYQVLGSESALTSMGQGLHIGAGVGEAIQALQAQSEHLFLEESGGLLMPVDRIGRGLDRVGLVVSAGERVRTGLLGITDAGSLRAGRALFDSLPLESVCEMGMSDLADEPRCIEVLVKTHPEILLISGGEDEGEEVSTRRWIEISRTVCGLLPQSAQPVIVFAGNPGLESTVRRRLEPVTKLHIAPNLQPLYGELDLVPAQNLLEQEIIKTWKTDLPGLSGLCDLSKDLSGITGRPLDRIVRFLSLLSHFEPAKRLDQAQSIQTGVLAVDLGGIYTGVSAGLGGLGGNVILDKFPDWDGQIRDEATRAIFEWADEPVMLEDAENFICNHALLPSWVPETRKEQALTQAFARYRLRTALRRLAENYSWFDYQPARGLLGHYLPIIASGAVVTNAPSLGSAMLTLLDGLQPWGITTMMLDRHHLLPLLGKIGEAEPILPVHILASTAFQNLGTVVSAVGDLRQGKSALTVHVETASGKVYTVDVEQGTLRRLIIPTGEAAVLDFLPDRKVDIGFGGCGQGGKLKITGGALGMIIDARGRPVQLSGGVRTRLEQQQLWLRTLGAENA